MNTPIITRERLKAFAPDARPDVITTIIDGLYSFDRKGISTAKRIQHFFAQIAVESAGLRRLEENLNYSAKRLHQVWPVRFPTIAAAQPYAHNPQALANRVYRNRLGNGSTASGDGWRFRGSGLMQTTGRDNFRAAGYENNPDALRAAGPALGSALKYWDDHKINYLADRDDVVAVRKAVNGGLNGLDDARIHLAHARKIFV